MSMALEQQPQERFIRRQEVENLVGLKHAKIYALMHGEAFPRQVRIGGAVRWRLSEIQKWMDEKIAASDAQ